MFRKVPEQYSQKLPVFCSTCDPFNRFKSKSYIFFRRRSISLIYYLYNTTKPQDCTSKEFPNTKKKAVLSDSQILEKCWQFFFPTKKKMFFNFFTDGKKNN